MNNLGRCYDSSLKYKPQWAKKTPDGFRDEPFEIPFTFEQVPSTGQLVRSLPWTLDDDVEYIVQGISFTELAEWIGSGGMCRIWDPEGNPLSQGLVLWLGFWALAGRSFDDAADPTQFIPDAWAWPLEDEIVCPPGGTFLFDFILSTNAVAAFVSFVGLLGGVTIVAAAPGLAGNTGTAELIDPAAANVPLSLAVIPPSSGSPGSLAPEEVAPMPQLVTGLATKSADIASGSPFMLDGVFYSLAFDTGTFAMNMYSSADGVTWAIVGGAGPIINSVFLGTKSAVIAGIIHVIYNDAGGDVAHVTFDPSTNTWGGVTTTAESGQGLGLGTMVASGTFLTLFTQDPGAGVQAQYAIFDTVGLTITPWALVGPNIYVSTRPVGLVVGVGGRVHMFGASDDGVDDVIWDATLYPATDTLEPFDEFAIADSLNTDLVLNPVAASNGDVYVYLRQGGTFNMFVGASADTIVFGAAIPLALPVGYTPAALLGNSFSGLLFVQNTAGVRTFQYATFDGVALSAFTVAGTVAATTQWTAAANDDVSNTAFWGLLFRPLAGLEWYGLTAVVGVASNPLEIEVTLATDGGGTITSTWEDIAELINTSAAAVGVVYAFTTGDPTEVAAAAGPTAFAGGAASTPVTVNGYFTGVKRFKEC